MKHFNFKGVDYQAQMIEDELVVIEQGTYNKINLEDRPKLAEMAANAVGGGGVDMAPNARKALMRKQVVRRWMDQWNQKNS